MLQSAVMHYLFYLYRHPSLPSFLRGLGHSDRSHHIVCAWDKRFIAIGAARKKQTKLCIDVVQVLGEKKAKPTQQP